MFDFERKEETEREMVRRDSLEKVGNIPFVILVTICESKRRICMVDRIEAVLTF